MQHAEKEESTLVKVVRTLIKLSDQLAVEAAQSDTPLTADQISIIGSSGRKMLGQYFGEQPISFDFKIPKAESATESGTPEVSTEAKPDTTRASPDEPLTVVTTDAPKAPTVPRRQSHSDRLMEDAGIGEGVSTPNGQTAAVSTPISNTVTLRTPVQAAPPSRLSSSVRRSGKVINSNQDALARARAIRERARRVLQGYSGRSVSTAVVAAYTGTKSVRAPQMDKSRIQEAMDRAKMAGRGRREALRATRSTRNAALMGLGSGVVPRQERRRPVALAARPLSARVDTN
eukprot:gnl/Dysnectes_brevis/1950_a2241_1206.p2 GENE.gnl/Dysnectes_brevis/1950_a2241_1206~~gnl/Dysnectes_brevis/1950_a2241_1206.p2  ORF type:complete len:288 (-),score=71.21 gnl/Dysnectes_brevis/1950_a2241_1206:115-978(-)